MMNYVSDETLKAFEAHVRKERAVMWTLCALGCLALLLALAPFAGARIARGEAWRRAPVARICPDGTRIYLFEGKYLAGRRGERLAPGVTLDQVCASGVVR